MGVTSKILPLIVYTVPTQDYLQWSGGEEWNKLFNLSNFEFQGFQILMI